MEPEKLTQLQEDTLRLVMSRDVSRPVTGKEIAKTIGLRPRSSGKDGADMRSIINALRVKGYPICATGEGYWWPKDNIELEAFVAAFQDRINSQQDACDGVRAGFKHVAKRPEQVIPQKQMPVMWQQKVHLVQENEVAFWIESHPGAERV